jgi:hypothetical protein
MDGQTESAFEASDMVFEEVRVLFEIDVFERELAETFASIGICGGMGGDAAAAEFGACAVLGEDVISMPNKYAER